MQYQVFQEFHLFSQKFHPKNMKSQVILIVLPPSFREVVTSLVKFEITSVALNVHIGAIQKGYPIFWAFFGPTYLPISGFVPLL